MRDVARRANGEAPNPHIKFGKPISNADIAPWDIDIRTSDGKGLPAGRGTVAEGKVVYDAKCLACHGADAKGGPVYGTMVGGIGSFTTNTRVLTPGSMYPYAPILFDYIRRSMPMDRPQSLTANEVYAVSAYILNLNGIIPDNAVMDQRHAGAGADAKSQRIYRRRPSGYKGRALHVELQVMIALMQTSEPGSERGDNMKQTLKLAACALLVSSCATTAPDGPSATAVLRPASGSQAHGTVKFTQVGTRVRVDAELAALTPGQHGFHLHEKGDCSAPDAASAGAHFNPTEQKARRAGFEASATRATLAT